jgi:predicted Ser/Thr protein kinase
MPTIELTDEQADELRDVITSDIEYHRDVYGNEEGADAIHARHLVAVLSDILELLEIA